MYTVLSHKLGDTYLHFDMVMIHKDSVVEEWKPRILKMISFDKSVPFINDSLLTEKKNHYLNVERNKQNLKWFSTTAPSKTSIIVAIKSSKKEKEKKSVLDDF